MTYEEKRKIVERVNARIRKIANTVGTQNREVNKFMNRLNANKTMRGHQSVAYTTNYALDENGDYIEDSNGDRLASEVEYRLLSRKKADIAQYDEAELERLDKNTKSWTKIRTDFAKDTGVLPTADEIRRRMTIQDVNRQIMEGHSELWYLLLDEEGWTQDEAQDKTAEEIYQALMKTRSKEVANGQFYDFTIASLQDPNEYSRYEMAEGTAQIRREMQTQEEAEEARRRMREHRAAMGI